MRGFAETRFSKMIGRPGLALMNFWIQPSMSTLPSPMLTQRTAIPSGTFQTALSRTCDGLGVGDQRLERHVRILEHPHRIARVEAHAHDVGADRLDHHLHLARLQVAAVVLHASLTPESTMRERMPRTALIMLSMCISICGRSGSPPRTQRMHVAPKICDALSARATCSSSVPSCALNAARARADRSEGELQLDAEPCRRGRGSPRSPLRPRASPAAARSSPTSA